MLIVTRVKMFLTFSPVTKIPETLNKDRRDVYCAFHSDLGATMEKTIDRMIVNLIFPLMLLALICEEHFCISFREKINSLHLDTLIKNY